MDEATTAQVQSDPVPPNLSEGISQDGKIAESSSQTKSRRGRPLKRCSVKEANQPDNLQLPPETRPRRGRPRKECTGKQASATASLSSGPPEKR